MVQEHRVYLRSLKALMKRQRLRQAQVGAALGVSQAAVSNWAIGKRNPPCDILPSLANVLGCSIDDLFKEEGEQ